MTHFNTHQVTSIFKLFKGSKVFTWASRNITFPINGILSIFPSAILPMGVCVCGGVDYTDYTSWLTACVKAFIISWCLFLKVTSIHCKHLTNRSDMNRLVFPPGFTSANKKGRIVVKFLSLHEMGATSGSNKSGQISFKQSLSEKPCDCLLITSLNINNSILFHATQKTYSHNIFIS